MGTQIVSIRIKLTPTGSPQTRRILPAKNKLIFHFVSIIDENVVGMRWAFIITVVVSLLTKNYDQDHADRCWKNF